MALTAPFRDRETGVTYPTAYYFIDSLTASFSGIYLQIVINVWATEAIYRAGGAKLKSYTVRAYRGFPPSDYEGEAIAVAPSDFDPLVNNTGTKFTMKEIAARIAKHWSFLTASIAAND